MYKITLSIFQNTVNDEAEFTTRAEDKSFILTTDKVQDAMFDAARASSALDHTNTLLKLLRTDPFIVSLQKIRWFL